MTPEQISALINPFPAPFESRPMIVHIRARGDVGIWECVITVKEEHGDRRFRERNEMPTARWTQQVRDMVDLEARTRLDGVGDEPLTLTETTATEYIMRRPFNDADRTEFSRLRTVT